MKYKHIPSAIHNFGHSFTSLMNYVDDGYVIDDLQKIHEKGLDTEVSPRICGWRTATGNTLQGWSSAPLRWASPFRGVPHRGLGDRRPSRPPLAKPLAR